MKVEVCLTPELIHQFSLEGKIVVVVDIFRATSCMVTGLAYGIDRIVPVAEVEECLALGEQGMITAGERGGQKIAQFDIGNSPFEYMQEAYIGQAVAVTTTNGTRAILASTAADQVLIGAFLNLQSIADYLQDAGKDVVIHCAGWQGTVNLEDTLFAGALIRKLKHTHEHHGDPALIARQLYKANKHDLLKIALESSHAKRLASFGVEKDLSYCLENSIYSVVPAFDEGAIQLL